MGQLEEMQTFVSVVDAGGIGAAAEQMGIAKSAISRRLADLESRLEMTLITRTTRTSKITEAGEAFYKSSLELIQEISELNTFSTEPERSIQGPLRITAPITFGMLHLTHALDLFAKEHPELMFDIELSNKKVDLVEAGFDLAIRFDDDLQDSSLKARKITQEHYNICASPEYLKQHGTPKTPADLNDHQLLSFSNIGNQNWNLYDNQGKHYVVNKPPKIISNNTNLINKMAITGHGIICLPSFVSRKAVASGKLTPILQDYKVKDMFVYAVYPNTRFVSQRVRLLIDFLVERFAENSYWNKNLIKQG